MTTLSELPTNLTVEEIRDYLKILPEKLKDGMMIDNIIIDFNDHESTFYTIPSNERVKMIKEIHRRLKSLYETSEKKSKKSKKSILTHSFIQPYVHALKDFNGFRFLKIIMEMSFKDEEMELISDDINIIWECDKDSIHYEILLSKYDIGTKRNPSTKMEVEDAKSYYSDRLEQGSRIHNRFGFVDFLKKKYCEMTQEDLMMEYMRLQGLNTDTADQMKDILDRYIKKTPSLGNINS